MLRGSNGELCGSEKRNLVKIIVDFDCTVKIEKK